MALTVSNNAVGSTHATRRRTFLSINPSIRTKAASTAVSIVTPCPPTPVWGCRLGLTSKAGYSPRPARPKTLERELRKLGDRPRTIMLGANTDPYQPIERQRKITRETLDGPLAAFNHPVAITTKSTLITQHIP